MVGCLNYLDTDSDCRAPLQGYRAKVSADVIDEHLNHGVSLSAQQHANLVEDRLAYRTAEANRTDAVDPKISGRMFSDLPQKDGVEINRRYGTFYNLIMSKCAGADHMGVGHTTSMDYIK